MSDIPEANFISRETAMTSDAGYQIRTMSRSDLDVAIAWAASEGWNPGLHDAETFYHTDPNGFFMGYLGGEPIASLSAVRYGDRFGFIGFYIVHPNFRGQGYGFKLWQAGMEYLAGRTIGLDGVVAQQANYQKSGFTLAYRNIRYEGTGQLGRSPRPMTRAETLDTLKQATQPLTSDTIDSLLLAYDREFFPDTRTEFLRRWVVQPKSYGVVLTQNHRLAGYGVVRPCQTGYKIGPLFADTVEVAEAIFLTLKNHMDVMEKQRGFTEEATAIAYPFYLDVPEPNAQAIALAQHYEMTPMFETARMYTPQIPDLPVYRIFGVTTFELG